MRIPQRRCQIGVSHITHDELRWNARCELRRRERVPEVMRAEVVELRPTGRSLEATIPPVDAVAWLGIPAAPQVFENERRRGSQQPELCRVVPKRLECLR